MLDELRECLSDYAEEIVESNRLLEDKEFTIVVHRLAHTVTIDKKGKYFSLWWLDNLTPSLRIPISTAGGSVERASKVIMNYLLSHASAWFSNDFGVYHDE